MEFFGSLLVDHEMTVPVLMGKGAIEVDSSFSS